MNKSFIKNTRTTSTAVLAFRVVWLIVLLHTFVPHPHVDELSEKEHLALHKKSKSIFGYLQLVFHENEDESLDSMLWAHYKGIKQTVKLFKPTFSIPIIGNYESSTKQKGNRIFHNNQNFFKLFFIVKPNGVRGSPQLTA